MANIARLNVDLVARTAGFTKGIAGARSALTGFLSPMKAVTAAAGLLGATLSTAAVASFVKGRMAEIDEIGKLADGIGATTEGFIQLSHAANLAGVSHDTFVKSMGRMVRNVAEAAAGSGTAKDALEELGVSAKALENLQAQDQFYVLVGALEKVENQAHKVRIAYDLFGREGINMLPIVKSGQQGLREMADDAEKLGLTFSRVDAAKVEEANDAMSRTIEALQGLGNMAAITVAPAVEGIANMLTDNIVKWQDMKDEALNALESITRAAYTAGAIAKKAFDIATNKDKNIEYNNLQAKLDELEKTKALLDKPMEKRGWWEQFWRGSSDANQGYVATYDLDGVQKVRKEELDRMIADQKEALRMLAAGDVNDIGLADALGIDMSAVDDFFARFRSKQEEAIKAAADGPSFFDGDLDALDEMDAKLKSLGEAKTTRSLRYLALNSQATNPALMGTQKVSDPAWQAALPVLKQIATHTGQTPVAVAG